MEFFTEETKEKYEETKKFLEERNVFEKGDEFVLSALFANYQRWKKAEMAIQEHNNLCFETATGYRQQIPEISIANNAMKAMLSFIKELGLSPKERNNLKDMLAENEVYNSELEAMIV